MWTAWSAGGYFPSSYLTAGVVAYAVLAVVLVVRPPHYALSTQALLAIAALALLAIWSGLSARWSLAPDVAVAEMQRNLVYAGVFGLAVIGAGSGRLARQLVWGTLCALLVIAVGGLLSRLYPDVVRDTIPQAVAAGYRLGYPFGYWNAFGAVCAMGTVLALGLAADPRSRVTLRAAAAGASVLLATAMYLSLSRGAWLALGAGILVLALLGSERLSLLLSAAIVGLFSLLAIAQVASFPALVEEATRPPGQLASGHEFGPQLLVLVGLAAVTQGVIAAGRASPNLMQALRRVFRPLIIGAGIVAVLIVAGVYAVKTAAVERRSAQALVTANAWVERQWDEFNRPTIFSQEGSARLSSARGTRSDYYRVALNGLRAHPLRGDGGGSFEVRWNRERRVDETVRNAHSLYHETLGELGLVGFGLLAFFLGSIVFAAVRSRLRPGALSRSQTAAVGAALAVWLAHNAFDWDWQMVAVTAPGLILAATLLPSGRRTGPSRPPVPRILAGHQGNGRAPVSRP